MADDTKYSIELMTYPLSLQEEQDYSNYVKFFINVQAESKIAKNSSLLASTALSKNEMNSLVGKPISSQDENAFKTKIGVAEAAKGAAIGAAAGGGSAAAGGKFLSNIVSSTAGGALKGAAASGLTAGAMLGALEVAGVEFGQGTKRLKAAIMLYTPNQLSVRYGTSWGEEEMDMALQLANTVNANSMDAQSAPIKNAVASEILKKSATYSSATRKAANPRKEQVFKGVEYRRFTFEYQFAPKNAGESQAVQNIIYMFKYHMHPEFKDDSANFIYIYPSEFDIEYYVGTEQNMNLNKISSCVLTEMNVNYTPNGVFSTFPDGSPTQINMTLNFVELEALTKERIDRGL